MQNKRFRVEGAWRTIGSAQRRRAQETVPHAEDTCRTNVSSQQGRAERAMLQGRRVQNPYLAQRGRAEEARCMGQYPSLIVITDVHYPSFIISDAFSSVILSYFASKSSAITCRFGSCFLRCQRSSCHYGLLRRVLCPADLHSILRLFWRRSMTRVSLTP